MKIPFVMLTREEKAEIFRTLKGLQETIDNHKKTQGELNSTLRDLVEANNRTSDVRLNQIENKMRRITTAFANFTETINTIIKE